MPIATSLSGLSSQFLNGHAVGIGHINDGLSFPGRQRLRDILVRLETYCQEDNVRFDRFRQFLGNNRGPDSGRSKRKAFRVAGGCNGYFDAASSKRLCQGLADIAKADDCITHKTFSFSDRIVPDPSNQVHNRRVSAGACFRSS
jgi:hypothetical protein